MKKNVLIFCLSLGFLSLTSCERNYSCNCTYEEFHDDHWDPHTSSVPLGELSKKDAETACESTRAQVAADDDHRNVDCTIKK
jgi:hypothetical protein